MSDNTLNPMESKTEQWRKDGWNHDPIKLADIMAKYSEMHDGSGGLDMEMIDDVLTISSDIMMDKELIEKEAKRAVSLEPSVALKDESIWVSGYIAGAMKFEFLKNHSNV